MRKSGSTLTLMALSLVLASPAIAMHHGSASGADSEKGGKASRFDKMDTNGDGKISRDEFVAMAAKRFDKMDANGDGSLSQDEMKRPRKQR